MDMGMSDGFSHSTVIPHKALPRSDARTSPSIH
ncbi:hypothetical protein CABS03_06017 [Colletotrichum abscissum]|uniref:Uncharacterized protein n=1 Tax=Colletotrichum abscissum TaxID=1671311 RepID=A0A9Q0AUV2_9PEZI|nr:hypothetical protein CABS02_14241 [Colletotrichum abscissum]